jgi:hypothetical protein
MEFIVGNDGRLRLDKEPKVPEVYRMSPYEFAETAEPVHNTMQCGKAILVQSSAISTTLSNPLRSVPASLTGSHKLRA